MTTTKKIPKVKANDKGDEVSKVENNFRNYLLAQVSTNTNSLREYLLAQKQFEEYLHRIGKTPKEITQDEVNGFIVEVKARYKNNSLIPKMGGLRHYLRYLGFNPSSKGGNIQVMIPKSQATRKDQVLTQEEIEQFFKASEDDPLSNAVIKTLYYEALRRNELMNLYTTDIDFDKKMLTVRNGKGETNQPERIPLNDEVITAIKRYLKVRPIPVTGHEEYLFLCSTNTKLNRTSVLNLIRRIQAKTNIVRKCYPHIFRSSIITHLHNNGADVTHIQELSRHKSLDALKLYIRSSDEEKVKNYNKFVPKIGDKPIPKPIPPEKKDIHQSDVMIATKQTPIDSSRQQELFNLLKEGYLTPQGYKECLSKQDNSMYG